MVSWQPGQSNWSQRRDSADTDIVLLALLASGRRAELISRDDAGEASGRKPRASDSVNGRDWLSAALGSAYKTTQGGTGQRRPCSILHEVCMIGNIPSLIHHGAEVLMQHAGMVECKTIHMSALKMGMGIVKELRGLWTVFSPQ